MINLINIDDYNNFEKIGEGGSGIVYKAIKVSTGQKVAIKTIKFKEGLDLQKKDELLKRFERETQLCEAINHSNIVQYIDKGYIENSQPYVVFEYIEGETLRAFLLRKNYLSAGEMSVLMKQVLNALIHAHHNGIVHRDLKPQNIMVTQIDGRYHLKILDFGIGAFVDSFRDENYQNLTITKDFLGTPAYSAPEQLKGEPLTVKSDLYSWGLIVIECLTGKPVMNGISVAKVFEQQLMKLNVPIPLFIIDHDLGNLLQKVLEKNPIKRIAKAQDVFNDFEQINFNTLIGNDTFFLEEQTIIDKRNLHVPIKVEKQLTFLCVRLKLIIPKGRTPVDLEMLDNLEKEQVDSCKTVITSCGGFILDVFMNNITTCFGYPEPDDVYIKRTSRTILELFTEVKRRNELLLKQYGIGLAIQMGLHTDIVLIKKNRLPKGNALNIAFDLALCADLGSVLVSRTSKKVLEPYLKFGRIDNIDIFNKTEITEAYCLIREREELPSLFPLQNNPKRVREKEGNTRTLKKWSPINNVKKPRIVKGEVGESKLIREIKSLLHARKLTRMPLST